MYQRGAKALVREEWDRLIKPLFEEYSPEYLYVRLYKRLRKEEALRAGVPKERLLKVYYGSKEFPFTVYTLNVEHKLLGVVWNGRDEALKAGVPIPNVIRTLEAS